jgi:4-hydroxythreonine-4-phosphate dehydrogenase
MRIPQVMTAGDPAGIGPEIAAKAWLARSGAGSAPFFLLTDPHFINERLLRAGISCPLARCAPEEACDAFEQALPVVAIENRFSAKPGEPLVSNAPGVVEAIDKAVELVFAKKASAIVTCPISKHVLYEAGFGFPGHTEYLAHLAELHTSRIAAPVMMLAGPDLKTVPVTVHIPLKDVPAALSTVSIVETTRIVNEDLKHRFRVEKPRIAVAGLNPHAGEGGSLGREDFDIVAPAVAALVDAGVDARGPLPADTLFHAAARRTYDAAICMYHDQALIPAKALAFDETVNVTLGLPFVRTSPDHGTAFDIAGRGTARADSLLAALDLAAMLSANEAS